MYRCTETICRLIEHVHPISMNSVNCIAMCTVWLSIGLVSCPVNVLDLPDGIITGGRLFKSLHYFCIPLLYFRQPFQFLWRQPLHLQGAPLIRSVQPPATTAYLHHGLLTGGQRLHEPPSQQYYSSSHCYRHQLPNNTRHAGIYV